MEVFDGRRVVGAEEGLVGVLEGQLEDGGRLLDARKVGLREVQMQLPGTGLQRIGRQRLVLEEADDRGSLFLPHARAQ